MNYRSSISGKVQLSERKDEKLSIRTTEIINDAELEEEKNCIFGGLKRKWRKDMERKCVYDERKKIEG